MKKYSLRILFALIAIAAITLALVVKQNRVAYSLSSKSPDGIYTCNTTATTRGSLIAWKLKVDTSITRNSDGLLCHREISMRKNEWPPDLPKTPQWSCSRCWRVSASSFLILACSDLNSIFSSRK